jgi:hypothetical protein
MFMLMLLLTLSCCCPASVCGLCHELVVLVVDLETSA